MPYTRDDAIYNISVRAIKRCSVKFIYCFMLFEAIGCLASGLLSSALQGYTASIIYTNRSNNMRMKKCFLFLVLIQWAFVVHGQQINKLNKEKISFAALDSKI